MRTFKKGCSPWWRLASPQAVSISRLLGVAAVLISTQPCPGPHRHSPMTALTQLWTHTGLCWTHKDCAVGTGRPLAPFPAMPVLVITQSCSSNTSDLHLECPVPIPPVKNPNNLPGNSLVSSAALFKGHLIGGLFLRQLWKKNSATSLHVGPLSPHPAFLCSVTLSVTRHMTYLFIV